MSFSLVRAGVFAAIGLPIGFILAGLGLAVLGVEITAPALAPFALGVALVLGAIAGFRGTAQ